MGLDMYLHSRPIDSDTEVAYWRKAYHIHNFFETNCGGEYGLDNCQRVYVAKEIIGELLDKCKKTKELLDKTPFEIKDNYKVYSGECKQADEIREIFSEVGEIDECFEDDTVNTISTCEKLLAEFDFENNNLYYHGWW